MGLGLVGEAKPMITIEMLGALPAWGVAASTLTMHELFQPQYDWVLFRAWSALPAEFGVMTSTDSSRVRHFEGRVSKGWALGQKEREWIMFSRHWHVAEAQRRNCLASKSVEDKKVV